MNQSDYQLLFEKLSNSFGGEATLISISDESIILQFHSETGAKSPHTSELRYVNVVGKTFVSILQRENGLPSGPPVLVSPDLSAVVAICLR